MRRLHFRLKCIIVLTLLWVHMMSGVSCCVAFFLGARGDGHHDEGVGAAEAHRQLRGGSHGPGRPGKRGSVCGRDSRVLGRFDPEGSSGGNSGNSIAVTSTILMEEGNSTSIAHSEGSVEVIFRFFLQRFFHE